MPYKAAQIAEKNNEEILDVVSFYPCLIYQPLSLRTPTKSYNEAIRIGFMYLKDVLMMKSPFTDIGVLEFLSSTKPVCREVSNQPI